MNIALRPVGETAGWPVALRKGRFHALAGDPAAHHPDAVVADGEDELLVLLNASLVRDHLGPIVEHLNALSGRPRAALWRSAADRLAGAFLWLGERMGCEPRASELARRALGFGPPLAGRVRTQPVRAQGRTRHVTLRDGCCLYYRVPGATMCLSCPLMDEGERARRAFAEA